MDSYLRSINTIAEKYNVSTHNIKNCIILGRLSSIDEKISVQEFSNVYHNDEKMVALEEIIEEVRQSEKWVLSKKNIEEIKKEIIKTNNWGNSFFLYENLLISIKKIKKTLYFENSKKEKTLIIDWIMHNLCKIPSENYKKMWEMLDERSKRRLVIGCGATPYENNIILQPELHLIMSEIILGEKTLEEWGVPEYQMFCKRHSGTKIQRLLRKILLSTESKDLNNFFRLAKVINYYPSKRNEEKYTINQYLSLGALLLYPSYYWGEGIIKRALDNSEIAQALLYMAMNIACAWRQEDILNIKLYEEVEIMDIIDELKGEKVTFFKTFRLWQTFKYSYESFEDANKNGEPLRFALTGEPEKHLGIYLAICEYHRVKENRDTLFSPNATFDKLKTYKSALGEKNYTVIFGDKIFRNRLMNKALLDGITKLTSVRFQNNNYRSFPQILSAYLRSHKLDLEKGQNTIFHYIDFSSEGLTPDEISMALFSTGTFGFYKNIVLSEILPRINDYNLKKRAQIISAANLSITETEDELGNISRTMDMIAGLEEQPGKLNILINRIMDAIVNDTGNGKEENVFCLYRALHNRLPQKCSCEKYCTNCNSELAYGKMCKFGIYAYEYIFNLTLRLDMYEKRIDEYIYLKEKLKREGDWKLAEVYEELYELEKRRRDNTRKTVEQFLGDKDFPDELRNDALNLYLGEI